MSGVGFRPKLRRFLLAALLLAVAPDAVAQSGTLHVVQYFDSASVDPLFTSSPVMRAHASAVFETLYALDSASRPKPMMVESRTVSPDQLTWRFTLRPGQRFHDGQTVTSGDVIPSLRRWMGRDAFGIRFARDVSSMEAVDDRTFVIQLKTPVPYVEAALGSAGGMLPVIMRAKDAATPPAQQVKEAIGSGPFRFDHAAWVSGSRRVYVRNDAYVPRDEPPDGLAGGRRVRVERMEWDVIPDAATAAAAIRTGEVDLWDQVPADIVPSLRADKALTVGSIQLYNSFGVIRPNFLFPPFNDVRARRALALMVDQRDTMTAAIGDEAWWRTCFSFSVCGQPYGSEAGSDAYRKPDLARARQLMIEAGYKGEPLVLLGASGNPVVSPLSQVLAEGLKSIGVNVDLQQPETAAYIGRMANKSPPGDHSGGWNLMVTFVGGVTAFQPLTNVIADMSCDGRNYSGWPCDAESERLRDVLIMAPDEKSREAALDAWQKRLWEEVPTVLLGQYKIATVWRTSLSGVLRAAIPIYWNISKK